MVDRSLSQEDWDRINRTLTRHGIEIEALKEGQKTMLTTTAAIEKHLAEQTGAYKAIRNIGAMILALMTILGIVWGIMNSEKIANGVKQSLMIVVPHVAQSAQPQLADRTQLGSIPTVRSPY